MAESHEGAQGKGGVIIGWSSLEYLPGGGGPRSQPEEGESRREGKAKHLGKGRTRLGERVSRELWEAGVGLDREIQEMTI